MTDRRTFLRDSMLLGAGVIAGEALTPDVVLAQAGPAPAAPVVAPKPPALTYAQVMTKARELMYPICRVCPECDGTVKYGHDVLKYIALGANAVLVGRHIVRGAHGGGSAGVALLMNRMQQEFVDAMVLTGCASVKAITRGILV
jgi:hypothetical protein